MSILRNINFSCSKLEDEQEFENKDCTDILHSLDDIEE